jgi:hypothetical protein
MVEWFGLMIISLVLDSKYKELITLLQKKRMT